MRISIQRQFVSVSFLDSYQGIALAIPQVSQINRPFRGWDDCRPPTSARSAESTAGTYTAKPCFRAKRPSGSPCRAPRRSPGRSAQRRLCRLFPGSLACSAEPCAVAMSWPGCGQFVWLSDGRVSAPKNDLPCALITFVVPDCPRKMFRWEPKLYSTGASRARSNTYEPARHTVRRSTRSFEGSHQLLHPDRRHGDGRRGARTFAGAPGLLPTEFSGL